MTTGRWLLVMEGADRNHRSGFCLVWTASPNTSFTQGLESLSTNPEPFCCTHGNASWNEAVGPWLSSERSKFVCSLSHTKLCFRISVPSCLHSHAHSWSLITPLVAAFYGGLCTELRKLLSRRILNRDTVNTELKFVKCRYFVIKWVELADIFAHLTLRSVYRRFGTPTVPVFIGEASQEETSVINYNVT